MLKARGFNAGQTYINYVEGPPSGGPLVLLHWITGRWQLFMTVIPSLVARWHVYALDLRGHGLSGRVPGKYRFVDYAKDVLAFFQSVVTEPAIVLGHSLGSMVAIDIAVEAPDRVRALVLEDPPLYMKGERSKEYFFYDGFVACRGLMQKGLSLEELAAALRGLLPEADAAFLRSFAKNLSLADPDILTQWIDGTIWEGWDTDELLKQVSVPTLLIQADPSVAAALDDGEAKRAASLIPQCTYVRMEGVGHGIHRAQPGAFLRVVTDFLESL